MWEHFTCINAPPKLAMDELLLQLRFHDASTKTCLESHGCTARPQTPMQTTHTCTPMWRWFLWLRRPLVALPPSYHNLVLLRYVVWSCSCLVYLYMWLCQHGHCVKGALADAPALAPFPSPGEREEEIYTPN
jgi:hypothetical protein